MSEIKQIRLVGRVVIQFNIEAVTGLHIGGTDAGIEIGGVDKTVIRDKLTNRPYIPGSSVKGKMRSLLEKYGGLPQNKKIGQGFIHTCDKKNDYADCTVCQVFGVPGEKDFSTPTRLVVRDTFLSQDSVDKLTAAQTDLPFTEVKTEVSIDRVTSAANPRQMERVPAGAVFGDGQKPAEIIYSLYDGADCSMQKDIERLKIIIEGLKLIEDDYLGGLGSRGSGKVRFGSFKVLTKVRKEAASATATEQKFTYPSLQEFETGLKDIQAALR